MQFRFDAACGKELSALGLGCMRFPSSAGRIDVDAAERLVREAVELGVNYLDTAYIYNGSEAALGRIFSRNPGLREKVNLATKLPIPRCESREDFDRYLERSLERLGTDHVDYYLVHNVTSASAWERLQALGLAEWRRSRKTADASGGSGSPITGPKPTSRCCSMLTTGTSARSSTTI